MDQDNACNQAVTHANVDAFAHECLSDEGRAIRGGLVEGQTRERRQEFGDETALALAPRPGEQREASDDRRAESLMLEFETKALAGSAP